MNESTVRREGGPGGARAFTLVELLIVVGIIALLVAIIMPSLNRAKELARQAICLTNQSNIVKSLHVYHADWDSFPYNYAAGYGRWGGSYERWALACLTRYVTGEKTVYLRNTDEGEFPRAYVCPSADLSAVYKSNPSDKYHACYWTNVAIRANRGFGGPSGGLFDTYGHSGEQPGWDVDSGGMARIVGRHCAGVSYAHWRSVYQPTLDSLKRPGETVFMGDTNNKITADIPGADGTPVPLYHATYPGEWFLRPGWGWIHGSLGFDRHLDKLLMSHVDGSARAFTHEYMDGKFSHWGASHGEKELTGDFMIQFDSSESCGGSHIHDLPGKVGLWE